MSDFVKNCHWNFYKMLLKRNVIVDFGDGWCFSLSWWKFWPWKLRVLTCGRKFFDGPSTLLNRSQNQTSTPKIWPNYPPINYYSWKQLLVVHSGWIACLRILRCRGCGDIVSLSILSFLFHCLNFFFKNQFFMFFFLRKGGLILCSFQFLTRMWNFFFFSHNKRISKRAAFHSCSPSTKTIKKWLQIRNAECKSEIENHKIQEMAPKLIVS